MSGVKDFVQHYEAHKKSVFTYILYRVSFDRDLAEDLTSEIFLKAFEYFDTYDKNRPFKPWIFRIARNHFINYLVSKKSQKTTSLEDIGELPHEANIEDKTDTKLLMERMEIFVRELPETQQELILLRYQNGLSHKEIAELVEKDEGAVRTAISRSLDALRQKYYAAKNKERIPLEDIP